MRIKKVCLSIIIGLTIVHSLRAENEVSRIEEALTQGKVSLNLRLSYEYSNLDDAAQHPHGEGINLQTRLGYRTADYHDTNVYLQFHSLINILDDFNASGRGGNLRRDVIADPDGERIHQAYIEFNGFPETRVRSGRLEILLDDQRFIGNVGWRQNGQSFDGVTLSYNPIEKLNILGAGILRVNDIFLEHTDVDHLLLLNVGYEYDPNHHFTAFTYLLDGENNTKSARDIATYGGRLDGIYADIFLYDFTYARQGDYRQGENHQAYMLNSFTGLKFDLASIGIGYNEISGQDGGDKPFDTLFGTTHKFQGWADQFTATNGGNIKEGIEEIYFKLGMTILATDFVFVYHIFNALENEDGIYNGPFGNEIDVDITRKFTDQLAGEIKLAWYNEVDNQRKGISNFTQDEEVFWARLMYSF